MIRSGMIFFSSCLEELLSWKRGEIFKFNFKNYRFKAWKQQIFYVINWNSRRNFYRWCHVMFRSHISKFVCMIYDECWLTSVNHRHIFYFHIFAFSSLSHLMRFDESVLDFFNTLIFADLSAANVSSNSQTMSGFFRTVVWGFCYASSRDLKQCLFKTLLFRRLLIHKTNSYIFSPVATDLWIVW